MGTAVKCRLHSVCVNGNCSKVQNAQYLCAAVYWIEFGLKIEDALSLFPFSRVLFYAIWKMEANKKGLKLNGHFSFWSTVMMLADCGKTKLHISKEMKGMGGLSCSLVKIAEIKVGQNQNTKISTRSSEIVSAFRYFERSIKNCN